MNQRSNCHCDVCATFATAFCAWRLKHHIPLRQVAKDLGMSVATINAWELGKRFPSGANLERLANYTGLPPCRLFCAMADQCVPADCLLALGQRP
ncbi:MAG: helix-turn-helix transcriptional regulator [Verrucomicrobia bacterium]|nr:helix-turn-helix transcriptional regulator [Verrucomicrobiota bacterium]